MARPVVPQKQKHETTTAFPDSPQRPPTPVSPSLTSADADKRRPLPSPVEPLGTAATSPEPGSINAILREHCRYRLYVRPILWTQDHLRLLGCEFVPKTLSPSRRKRDDVGLAAPKEGATQLQSSEHRERRQERMRFANLLRRQRGPPSKKFAVDELLDTYGLDSDSSGPVLFFFFGGQSTACIDVETIFTAGSTDVIAYVNGETTDCLRKKRYGTPCQRVNKPVASLQDKKLRAIQPTNPTEDPYIAATLIALAQRQYWQNQPTECGSESDEQTQPTKFEESDMAQKKPPTYKVRLLFLPGEEAKVMYAYKASIPSAFLDKLATPSRFSPCDPVRISYYELPLYKPRRLLNQFPRVLGLTPEQRQGAKPDPRRRWKDNYMIYPQPPRVEETTLEDVDMA